VTAQTYLRPPWENIERQHQAVSFAIWLFLGSEVLFFAGAFAGYAVYRGLYPQGFAIAGGETDIVYGTINTAILLTSSFFIAVAGRAAHAKFHRLAYRLLLVTFALGMLFLVFKGFEYREDIEKHLVPNAEFALANAGAGAMLFFSYYWLMTGIHALHVTAGLIAVARLLLRARRDLAWLSGSAAEEGTALYWHLVDVIWLVLYPLLYLTGRSHG
jgi:cytochrome c oxidase subunit 3